jgi:iron complex outermembrane receptor protein
VSPHRSGSAFAASPATPLPDSLDPRIIDIDHIEVLRGPQGTLFGASSMGGMIRIITQQPSLTQFSGTADVQGYGMSHSSDPGGEVSAVVNLPLVNDMAAVRLSAFESYQPGFFKRTYDDPQALDVTGQPVPGPAHVVNNVGSVKTDGFGATFRIDPIANLELTPMLRWQRTEGDGFPLADYNQNNLVQRRVLDQPESYNDEFLFGAFTAAYTTPFGKFVSSTTWFQREFYDLEDGGDANSAFLSPTKLLPGPGVSQGHVKTFTEEDRFESHFEFPVQVSAGVFYQNAQTPYINVVNAPGLDTEPGSPFDTNFVWNLTAKDTITQLAGFVSLTYTPIDPLQFEIGGRESYLTNQTYAFSSGVFGTGLGQTKISDSAFTPRFSAKYTFAPETIAYVTAAQGFRVGGANVPIGSACTGFGFSTTAEIPYSPDNLWSYEGGVKTTAFGGRVSASADVYEIDWSKIQQTEDLSNGANGCFAGLTLNLGKAKSDGTEVEITAKATDQLTLHFAGGYEDAHLTSVTPGTEYTVGEPLSGVPKWTASASADYEIPQAWGSYFARAQYSYNGGSVSYTEVATGLWRDPYSLLDLRIGANYHNYSLTFFGKNLTDARPNLSDEVAVTALAENRYRFWVGPPRELGVDLRVHF